MGRRLFFAFLVALAINAAAFLAAQTDLLVWLSTFVWLPAIILIRLGVDSEIAGLIAVPFSIFVWTGIIFGIQTGIRRFGPKFKGAAA